MAETKKADFPNLATALVAFQSNLPKIRRTETAKVGTYSYDYASLDKITPIIFKELSAVGLAYTAAPTVIDGTFGLYAQLVHTSGEAIGGLYPLGNPNARAQDIGSAITYARRYALLALTGVQPDDEDDDGAAASDAQAAANAAEKADAAPKKETAQDFRDKIAALINDEDSLVVGDDANAVLEEVAPGKSPNQWTLTDLKKALPKLQELSDTRKGDKK